MIDKVVCPYYNVGCCKDKIECLDKNCKKFALKDIQKHVGMVLNVNNFLLLNKFEFMHESEAKKIELFSVNEFVAETKSQKQEIKLRLENAEKLEAQNSAIDAKCVTVNNNLAEKSASSVIWL